MSPSISFPFPTHLSRPKPRPDASKPSKSFLMKPGTSSDTSTRTTASTTASTTPSQLSTPVSPTTPSPSAPEKPSTESTLSKLRALYAPLTRLQQTYLLQLAHFIHLHATTLNLSAYDLVEPVEESILSRRGRAYEELLNCLQYSKSREEPSLETLVELAESVNNPELRENYHKPYPANGAKKGPNPNEIRGCARPLRVQDSRNEWYTWVRGSFNVSPRIARNDILLKDPLGHAERLRVRGGRKDVFVSGWIVSRIESAERVERSVRIEGERLERERRERVELERLRIIEREKRVRRKEEESRKWILERDERERSGSGVMTRTRRAVCYAESVDSGEDESDSAEGESAGEEFVCEEVLDGSDNDDAEMESEEMDEEMEDEEMEENVETRVIGRVRVSVSDRSRRAERRARRVKKDLESDEDDVDVGRGVRRSKRLRSMKN